MARAFDQIQAELDNYYAPSVNIIQKQLETIPQATEAAIQQADAKKDLAFDQITNSARRRGMGFSGIPLDEQAVYASTEYAPAIARLKGDAENRRTGLLEAIYGINRDKFARAQSIYDNEVQRDQQERQFQEGVRQFNERMALERQNAARQAAASAPSDIGAYFGGGNTMGVSQNSAQPPAYGFKNGKDGSSGFWFKDASGRDISAAKYAQISGKNVNQIVGMMAENGDRTARSLLQEMRGPGVTSPLTKKYNSLFW